MRSLLSWRMFTTRRSVGWEEPVFGQSLFALTVLGCASTTPKVVQPDADVAVVFQTCVDGEIEPCG